MPNWTTDEGESLFDSELAASSRQSNDLPVTDQDVDQAIGEALGTLRASEQPIVWWLTQDDLIEIMDPERLGELSTPLPEWLLAQMRSAYGRNGRGRLWVDPQFGNFEMTFPDDNLLADHCGECCGIVISRRDLTYLAQLPGLLTDRHLRRIDLDQHPTNVLVWRGSISDLATDVVYLLTREGAQQFVAELNRLITLPHLADKFQGKG